MQNEFCRGGVGVGCTLSSATNAHLEWLLRAGMLTRLVLHTKFCRGGIGVGYTLSSTAGPARPADMVTHSGFWS